MIPAAVLIPEKASSSWFARTCWLFFPANVLAVRMPSAKLTRKMPMAAGSRLATSRERRAGNRDARQAGRYLAHHGDAVLLEVERPREGDRGDDDDQRRRKPRQEESSRDERAKRDCAHEDGRPAHVPERTQDVRDLSDRLRRVDVDSQQFPELAADEHDRDAVDVADEHRPGEVVGQPAESDDPGQQEACADQEREHRGELRRLAAPCRRHRQHGGADERRDRAFRPDDQLARRAEERVEDGR